VLFAEERWEVTDRLWISAGARYSYIGFLADRNHVDPAGVVEFEADRRTRLRGAFTTRTLTPGGDLLTLSTLSSSPTLAYAVVDDGLRPERLMRYELSVSHDHGPVTLAARVFHEDFRDPYVNQFREPVRSLRISNAPSVSARGMGVTVGRRFGLAVDGSVSYSYGRSSLKEGSVALPAGGAPAFRDNDFHDLAARLQAVLRQTDTRIVAFCRVNTLAADAEGPGAEGDLLTRFDVQLSQGIPFLGELTRADWELLLAYRNLFYETTEGGTLDELTVLNSPSRVLGGITVRF
jgi:outer membrane receptor protein involved in Fe transport